MLHSRRISDKYKLLSNFKRLKWVLKCSQTVATRFWFSLTSLGFGYFMLNSQIAFSEYALMLKIASPEIWCMLFTIHGLAMLYGVSQNLHNKILLLLEGILGIIIWTTAGIAVTIAQGALGAIIAGTLISFWLLVRYPTNEEYKDGL